MSQLNYLSDKVRVARLPVFEGPPTADAPPLKRMLFGQGELAQFYDDPAGIHYIAFIELREGTVRGNHYHKVKKEFIYVLGGELMLIVEDVSSHVRETVRMETGDLAIVATGVAHALKVITTGQAIEFSPAQYDPADTFRYPLA